MAQHVGLPIEFLIGPGPGDQDWLHIRHSFAGASFMWGAPMSAAREVMDGIHAEAIRVIGDYERMKSGLMVAAADAVKRLDARNRNGRR